MQPVVDSIHELLVGVETLGPNQTFILVIAWCQVRTVRKVVENLPVEELDWSICASRGVRPCVVVQENDAFSEHPTPFVLDQPPKLIQHFTRNIITIYTTQSTNLGCTLSFCAKKTNHSTYFTAGGSGDDSVHVSSVITPTQHSENVWW